MNKETLSTSEKEVPKTRLALQEKYKEEKSEPHAKRLDPDNIALERSNLLKFAFVRSQFSHFLVFLRVVKSFSS